MKRTRLFHRFKSQNLFRLVIGLPAGIFLAEITAMIIVYFLKGAYWFTILIDAVIATALMLPLIYILSYRPLLNDIVNRERTKAIMEFRLRLMQFGITNSLDELLQVTLDEIEALIGGTIGFFHFLEADQNTLWLQAWSTNTIQCMCNAEGKGSHYNLDQAGIWADCARLRQPVVHNDYALLENRKGTPEGHALISRELTVPILREGQVVAILGIGNKPTEFTPDDVDLVSTLSDFAWDIIERKRAEDALRESEEKFRTLVDWTYDWEIWIDPQGDYIYNSPSCQRMSGYSPEEFIVDPTLSLRIVHPDDLKAYEEHQQFFHDNNARASNFEYRIIAFDGSVRWIDHICRPLQGKDKGYLGRRISNRDITDRKLAEQEAMRRNQNESMLTQTIHTLQLEIARDLHDTIGQNIGYLRMKLDHLSEADPQTCSNLNTEITSMLKVANESYDLIRGTLEVLQADGLLNPFAFFIQYAAQIEERSPFKIHVSSRGEPRLLSPNQVRQIFFAYREALSNIEKHAKASKVSVELAWNHDHLSLVIVDDGQGFQLEEVPAGSHYGLRFMQERMNALNGTFSIQSAQSDGTTLTFTLPFA